MPSPAALRRLQDEGGSYHQRTEFLTLRATPPDQRIQCQLMRPKGPTQRQNGANIEPIISKIKPSSVDYNPVKTSANEARSLTAVIEGITIVNLYVVNGKDVGTDKYAYKLEWLKKLESYAKTLLSKTDQLVMLGDFNIAPTDDDVFDVEKTKDQILCSQDERKSLQKLVSMGLHDVFHDYSFPSQTFTWWDYRSGAFQRNIGYRIDLVLLTDSLKKRCTDYHIDKDTRYKSWCLLEPRTSDHAPVRITLK